jgi:four helix bundle protein
LQISDCGFEQPVMTSDELKKRTKQFSIDVVRYCRANPDKEFKYTIGSQLIRSACSTGANYRSACRGRSKAEFNAKLGICEEEADESMFWLEVIMETCDPNPAESKRLWKEAEELLKIFVKSLNTAKSKVS